MKPTYLYTHMKRNSYDLYSKRERNSSRASWFNRTYRYIDVVWSIQNQDFENYHGQMHPVELESKDTSDSIPSVSNLDLLLSIVRAVNVINFHVTNFPVILSHRLYMYDTSELAPHIHVLFSRISSKLLKH